MRRLTLLIDADDTLWENNVFFEKTIERFLSLVEPFGYARNYSRRILNETERLNIRQHGYGVRSFGRSLEETYSKLAGSLAQRDALREVIGDGRGAREHAAARDRRRARDPLLPFRPSPHDRVHQRRSRPNRLPRWSARGCRNSSRPSKSSRKRTRSTYQDLIDRHHVVKSHAWMVGNSPRSDINPALQGRLECRLHSSSRDLGARRSGIAKWFGKTADRREVPRPAGSLLRRAVIRLTPAISSARAAEPSRKEKEIVQANRRDGRGRRGMFLRRDAGARGRGRHSDRPRPAPRSAGPRMACFSTASTFSSAFRCVLRRSQRRCAAPSWCCFR